MTQNYLKITKSAFLGQNNEGTWGGQSCINFSFDNELTFLGIGIRIDSWLRKLF